uniref:Uncharacterized protein n=1 Tax=Arundo donax TaxID=35708 RepID=A0A0A9HI64_ARUDO
MASTSVPGIHTSITVTFLNYGWLNLFKHTCFCSVS